MCREGGVIQPYLACIFLSIRGPSVHASKPVEEKIFEEKITDVFHYGYTIESHIEGKPLRGLLFSYKPGFAHAVHAYLTR